MLAITGATGHLGRATIHALLPKVASSDIVALVRDPAKADDLRQLGVQLRQGDYNDPASLLAAFRGVEQVLLVSTSELDDQIRTQQHRHVIDAARQAGVRQLVYTSVLNPSRASHFGGSASHLATEEYLKASGLTYTVLRNTLYLDLVPTFAGAESLPVETVYSAAADGKVSFVLREEIGQALANVLTSAGHGNQVYDIAPAPAYSMQDVANALGKIGGQPVAYVPITAEQMRAGMREHHVPGPVVDLMVGIVSAMRDNEFNATSNALEQLLGRKPTDLKTHLTRVYAN